MVMSAVAEVSHLPGKGALVGVWLVLLFAAAGVFHHAGIKIPFFAFFGHDAGLRVKEAPKNMLIAMGIASFLCIFIGTFPQFLYRVLPYATDYQPYTISHVLTQTELLFFSALAFVLLLLGGIYPAEQRAVNLDADWVYRKGGRGVYALLSKTLNPMNARSESVFQRVIAWATRFFKDTGARIALFLSVNVWLASGMKKKRLELKKNRLYNDVLQETLPIGMGAAIAVSFIILVFILT